MNTQPLRSSHAPRLLLTANGTIPPPDPGHFSSKTRLVYPPIPDHLSNLTSTSSIPFSVRNKEGPDFLYSGGGLISGPFMPAVFTGLRSPSKNFPTGFVDGARFSMGVTGSSGNIWISCAAAPDRKYHKKTARPTSEQDGEKRAGFRQKSGSITNKELSSSKASCNLYGADLDSDTNVFW